MNTLKLADLVLFLSTLSLRRATRLCTILYSCPGNFYPRSPCGERQTTQRAGWRQNEFLSTLSLRRATYQDKFFVSPAKNFYPRSPCGERRWLRRWQLAARDISIHALLAESDGASSRPEQPELHISIHALLAESDAIYPSSTPPKEYFYPRSPCGERLLDAMQIVIIKIFLSTLSLRRATAVIL